MFSHDLLKMNFKNRLKELNLTALKNLRDWGYFIEM